MQMLQASIYTNDYVFNISMNCIKKQLQHIANCIIGADRKNKYIIDVKCK